VEIKQLKKKIEFYLESFFQEKEKEFRESEVFKEAVKKIKEITLTGGKRIRPIIFFLSFSAFSSKKKEEALKTSIFLELIHSYLLIHDDIIDNDTLRRNKPTTWYSYEQYLKKMGLKKNQEKMAKDLAIIAGDLACSWAYQILSQSKFAEELKIKGIAKLNEMLEKVIEGQFLDILLPLKKKIKKSQVLRAYLLKTASYTFQHPFQIGAILAGLSPQKAEEFSSFALPLGIAFQIQDDILGLWAKEKEIGKPLATDLREGKRTLLWYFASQKIKKRDKNFLQSLIGKKRLRKEEIEKAREIFSSSLALAKSKKLSQQLINQSEEKILSLKIKKEAKKNLIDLVNFLKKRNV